MEKVTTRIPIVKVANLAVEMSAAREAGLGFLEKTLSSEARQG